MYFQYDVDKNGTISPEEFISLLKHTASVFEYIEPTPMDISEYIDKADLNKDGQVDFREFEVFIATMRRQKEKLEQVRSSIETLLLSFYWLFVFTTLS
jgi:Ca2+-binding EF-hand superfamily protein